MRMNRLGDYRYIGHFLRVMIKSTAKRPSLTIQCVRHQKVPCLHLFFARGALHAMCLFKCSEGREREVREVFAGAGVTLVQDEVTGDARDQSRFLLYRLPLKEPDATQLVASFFQRGYHLLENTELDFTYRERKAT